MSNAAIDFFSAAESPARLEGVDFLARPLSELRQSGAFLLALNKESGKSSGFFLNQIRWRLSRIHRVKRFKVGHSGTLDPFADGVLLVLGGKATSLQDRLMHAPKSYLARIRFGATTPSFDPDTPVSDSDPDFRLDASALATVLSRLQGEIEQLPPAWSAKKLEGKRSYEVARKGGSPELSPVRVRLDKIELVSHSENDAIVRLQCGSGFYVRAMARDVAAALGTVGYVTELTRIASGGVGRDGCLAFRAVLDAIPFTDPAATRRE